MQQEYSLQQLYYKVKKVRVSSPNEEALRRFDAVQRFEQALSKGLSSADAAKVVGVARSTLYRWRKRKTISLDSLSSKSRRPKRLRKGKDLSMVGIRIQQLREEHPRWGKRKITKLLKNLFKIFLSRC